jgi:hypothetical protein
MGTRFVESLGSTRCVAQSQCEHQAAMLWPLLVVFVVVAAVVQLGGCSACIWTTHPFREWFRKRGAGAVHLSESASVFRPTALSTLFPCTVGIELWNIHDSTHTHPHTHARTSTRTPSHHDPCSVPCAAGVVSKVWQPSSSMPSGKMKLAIYFAQVGHM